MNIKNITCSRKQGTFLVATLLLMGLFIFYAITSQFPVRPNNNRLSPLVTPDLDLACSDELVKNLLDQVTNKGFTIPLEESNQPTSIAIIESVPLFEFTAVHTIKTTIAATLKISRFYGTINLNIPRLTLEIAPRIAQRGKQFFLEADAAITFLDINWLPSWLDKWLAHFISDYLHPDQLQYDLTHWITYQYQLAGYQLNPNIKRANLFIEKGKLMLSARLQTPKEK